MPLTSFSLLCLLQADIENDKGSLLASNDFTIVVFPAPEGAEKIMAFPVKLLSDITTHLRFALLFFPIHLSFPPPIFEFLNDVLLNQEY